MLQELGRQIIRAFDGDDCLIAIIRENFDFLRIANSTPIQQTTVENVHIFLLGIYGNKIGSGYTNSFEREGILNLVKMVRDNALNSKEYKEIPVFPSELKFEKKDSKDSGFDTFAKYDFLNNLVKDSKSLEFYGGLSSSKVSIYVATMGGGEGYNEIYDFFINLKIKGKYLTISTLYGGKIYDKEKIFEKIESEKTFFKYDDIPVEVELDGIQDFVLESQALKELLVYLEWNALSAYSHQKNVSFLKNKIGQKIFSDLFTFEDNPFIEETVPYYFDFQGVERKKISIFDKGVYKQVLYDIFTALTDKVNSTGNGSLIPFHSVIFNPYMKPGEKPQKQILENIERGIYIKSLHYLNIPNPFEGEITGMSRGGVFYIENGKIKGNLKNFRFMDTFKNIFGSIKEVSKEIEVIPETHSYEFRNPHVWVLPKIIKIGKFNILDFTKF